MFAFGVVHALTMVTTSGDYDDLGGCIPYDCPRYRCVGTLSKSCNEIKACVIALISVMFTLVIETDVRMRMS